MSKKKKEENKPLPFAEVDPVRQTMGWHMQELIDLYKRLEPHKTTRGTIAGCDEAKENVFILFKGDVGDLFNVKEFIDRLKKESDEK